MALKLVFLGRLEDAAGEAEREVVHVARYEQVLADLETELVAALADPRIKMAVNGEIVWRPRMRWYWRTVTSWLFCRRLAGADLVQDVRSARQSRSSPAHGHSGLRRRASRAGGNCQFRRPGPRSAMASRRWSCSIMRR